MADPEINNKSTSKRNEGDITKETETVSKKRETEKQILVIIYSIF
jgi:hypothetical protein